jgi:hypothetical protein
MADFPTLEDLVVTAVVPVVMAGNRVLLGFIRVAEIGLAGYKFVSEARHNWPDPTYHPDQKYRVLSKVAKGTAYAMLGASELLVRAAPYLPHRRAS